MKRFSGSRIRGLGRIFGATAVIFFVGATVGRTGAAFTATAPVEGSVSSGRVELDTGGVERLTFGGADLTAIGPGASFSQSVTVANTSTVTVPSAVTEIALWADGSAAPADLGGLADVLQVSITQSIGGGATATLYSGSLAELSGFDGFSTSIGSLWLSTNGGAVTGVAATRAVYTFTFSLPADSSSGAGSTAGISFVFEARNRTT